MEDLEKELKKIGPDLLHLDITLEIFSQQVKTKKVINDFIAKMESESYEQDKIKDIKIILYNNKEKINIKNIKKYIKI